MRKTLSMIIIGTMCFSMFSVLAPNVGATDLGSWVTKASMPTPRLGLAAVTYGGKIYAIGGSDRSGGGTERPTSIVEIYDPAIDSWTTGASMPAPKYHTGAVAVGDKIYVMGHDDRLFSYDPVLDSWAEHASVPADATYGFGIGVVDGKIYAVKGSPYYPSGDCWTYCYDPSSDTWTLKAPLPFTRSTDSLATLNGKLYAIGGIEPTGGWVHCTRVDVYDPETDSWELDSIARLAVPRTHLEADTPIVNGKIYVIGGWNGYTALSTVEEYDPATDSWQTLASMPTARYALATAVFNNRIYALGGDWGGLGGHIQSVNEEYTSPAAPAQRDLEPEKYCPYVFFDNGFGSPWDTSPDLPTHVFHTGTYFWGDLRVIQYWFRWEIDYMWWLQGFANAAYKYTLGRGWTDPLRQTAAAAGGADWEPIIVIVDDEGLIDSVLWRWHYNWFKYDPGLFSPTYQGTHIKLWWSVASHTPLNKYLAVDVPILLQIASWLKTPNQFKTAIGQYGDLAKPPLFELYEYGVAYPCGMQEWDEDLALGLGFSVTDLKYVANPTIAYSELVNLGRLLRFIVQSPVDILVTAPNGARVGYDSVTQTTVNEIEGATYSGPGTEPQVVSIPSSLPGVYAIDIVGTDSGLYTMTILSWTEDGLVAGVATLGNEINEGEKDHCSASVFSTGGLEVYSGGSQQQDLTPWIYITVAIAIVAAIGGGIALARRRGHKRKPEYQSSSFS